MSHSSNVTANTGTNTNTNATEPESTATPEAAAEDDTADDDEEGGVDEKYLERADNVLTVLTYDHRFCANCYKRIRDVETPDEAPDPHQIPDCVIGFAYPTKITEPGVGLANVREATTTSGVNLDPAESVALPSRGKVDPDVMWRAVYAKRMICECGVTSHTTYERPIKKKRAITYAENLADALTELRQEYLAGSEGKVAKARKWSFDRDVLLQALGEFKSTPELQFQGRTLERHALAIAIKHG